MTIICSGLCAAKQTDPQNPLFQDLENNAVVFENGRCFQFTDQARSNGTIMIELPPIEDKHLLSKIFSDIDNTLGRDGPAIIENNYHELIWEY